MQVKELQERTEQLDRSLRESPTAQQISELQQMLNEERKRADMLQEILDEELAKGTKASLARQLADALRDVEEAREELRQLRRQSEKTGQSGTVEARVDNMESPSPSLAAVLADLPAEKRRNLADALAATNILGEDQLSEAVQVQKQHPGTSPASVLLDKNMVQPEVLAEIVSLLTRVPVVSLDTLEIDKNAVAMVPTKLARMRRCIPIRVDDQEIEVAMESPMDLVAVEDIERATAGVSCRKSRCVRRSKKPWTLSTRAWNKAYSSNSGRIRKVPFTPPEEYRRPVCDGIHLPAFLKIARSRMPYPLKLLRTVR